MSIAWMFAFNTDILPLEEKLCVYVSLVSIRPQLRGVNRTPWNTRIHAYLAWDLEWVIVAHCIPLCWDFVRGDKFRLVETECWVRVELEQIRVCPSEVAARKDTTPSVS